MNEFKVGDYVEVSNPEEGYEGHKEFRAKITDADLGEYKLENLPIWFLEKELTLIDELQQHQETSISNVDLHRQILDQMHSTYKSKNADYGNSFEEQFKEYGLLSALIRLDDKMRRMKQLSKHEAQVKDESIQDTLLDLACYAVMTLMELRKGSVKTTDK